MLRKFPNKITGNKMQSSPSHRENTTFETNPILLSLSEDDIELDTSEIEIEKIASKYSKRRSSERNRRMFFFVILLSIVFIVATFTVLHQNFSSRGNRFNNNDNSKKIPKHPEFKHLKSQFIPGYQASMHLFRHEKTLAEFIAYIPIDKNQDKAFGISFRTKPTSDNGVAHILEHSVLSGSKKYPSKDPFVHLLKGSLNTFLNAMTYNDRTVYPIASRNKKDFFNLMSVYLDAVFFPKCVEKGSEWILKQEGWRYDFDDSANFDKNGTSIYATNGARRDLVVKGVVYSEMKGVFSDPESLLSTYTDKYLFPDNTYSYTSGGDPEFIPTLTQKEFSDFHKKYYHPTNSQTFISGTLEDIEKSMELIDSEYLSKFDVNPNVKEESQISYQKKKFANQLNQSRPYAVSEEKDNEGQHLLSITWLLNDSIMKPLLEISFYVLDYLLVGTKSAPLYKKLIDSGLGSNIIGNGLSVGLLQSTFCIGMEGVRKGNVADLEYKILGVLSEIEQDGFSDDDIKAALNSIEFQLREVHTGSTPMGLTVFFSLLQKWNYDQDPFSALEFETGLESLKKVIKKQGSSYFQSLIRDFLIDNNHRVHMELRPSETLEQTNIDTEKKTMESLKNSLSAFEYKAIEAQASTLKEIQSNDDSQDIVDMIPSLNLEDIDRQGVEYPIEVTKNAFGTEATMVSHPIDGSPGIVYIDFGIDISSLPFSEIGLVPLVTSILNECDTKSYTRAELNRLIGIYSGGISVELMLLPVHDIDDAKTLVQQGGNMRSLLFLRGKCTVANTKMMLSLFREIIEGAVLAPKEKVLQIIERKISSFKSNISSSGHSYAATRMQARYNPQSYINERFYGVSQLNALRTFQRNAADKWPLFSDRLTKILEQLSSINLANVIVNLTGDSDVLGHGQSEIKDFLTSFSRSNISGGDYNERDNNYRNLSRIPAIHPWIEAAQEEMSVMVPVRDEGIVVSSQVSYVGKVGKVYNMGEEVSGSSCIPVQYLKKGYLWDEVRAKNGAYGVMAQLGSTDGTLLMVSYRDPNLVKTLEVYDNAGGFLQSQLDKNVITEKDITKSIIGCIGSLDYTALPPKNAGWISFTRYLSNSSAARRQKWRDGILNANRNDIANFAQKLKSWKNLTTIAVVSSERKLQDAEETSNLVLERIDAS